MKDEGRVGKLSYGGARLTVTVCCPKGMYRLSLGSRCNCLSGKRGGRIKHIHPHLACDSTPKGGPAVQGRRSSADSDSIIRCAKRILSTRLGVRKWEGEAPAEPYCDLGSAGASPSREPRPLIRTRRFVESFVSMRRFITVERDRSPFPYSSLQPHAQVANHRWCFGLDRGYRPAGPIHPTYGSPQPTCVC